MPCFTGTHLPLIQAPMAGVQDWRLAAAVSEAGGLGSLPAGMLSAAQLEEQLGALAQATRRPWGVNFFCHSAPDNDPQGEARWASALGPLYQTYDVNPADIPTGPSRKPFDADAAV